MISDAAQQQQQNDEPLDLSIKEALQNLEMSAYRIAEAMYGGGGDDEEEEEGDEYGAPVEDVEPGTSGET